jgi:hypothetical protein
VAILAGPSPGNARVESKIEESYGIVEGGEERGLSEEYKGVAGKMEKII